MKVNLNLLLTGQHRKLRETFPDDELEINVENLKIVQSEIPLEEFARRTLSSQIYDRYLQHLRSFKDLYKNDTAAQARAEILCLIKACEKGK